MDSTTLEKLAELICGDNAEIAPIYRKGWELTKFLQRAGITRFEHDGSTRKWWMVETLKACGDDEIKKILLRLASPKEYGGDQATTAKACNGLNKILYIEGLKIEYSGIIPQLVLTKPEIKLDEKSGPAGELEPLPPPDFYRLGIKTKVAEILKTRWEEAEKCVNAKAYLASVVLMGSLLEGLILSVMQRKPKEANLAKSSPKDPKTGSVKMFHEWTLSDMIDVAHENKWVDLDVKKFSHALRSFRNLIHPYEQMSLNVYPDEDTSKICWLVVQAATNDLARFLL